MIAEIHLQLQALRTSRGGLQPHFVIAVGLDIAVAVFVVIRAAFYRLGARQHVPLEHLGFGHGHVDLIQRVVPLIQLEGRAYQQVDANAAISGAQVHGAALIQYLKIIVAVSPDPGHPVISAGMSNTAEHGADLDLRQLGGQVFVGQVQVYRLDLFGQRQAAADRHSFRPVVGKGLLLGIGRDIVLPHPDADLGQLIGVGAL